MSDLPPTCCGMCPCEFPCNLPGHLIASVALTGCSVSNVQVDLYIDDPDDQSWSGSVELDDPECRSLELSVACGYDPSRYWCDCSIEQPGVCDGTGVLSVVKCCPFELQGTIGLLTVADTELIPCASVSVSIVEAP